MLSTVHSPRLPRPSHQARPIQGQPGLGVEATRTVHDIRTFIRRKKFHCLPVSMFSIVDNPFQPEIAHFHVTALSRKLQKQKPLLVTIR